MRSYSEHVLQYKCNYMPSGVIGDCTIPFISGIILTREIFESTNLKKPHLYNMHYSLCSKFAKFSFRTIYPMEREGVAETF